MDVSTISDNIWWASTFAVVLMGLYIALNKLQSKSIFSRISHRRPSTAKASPQSISSEMKPNRSPESPNYANVLPPQRREALIKILGEVQDGKEEEVLRHILPMDTNYETCQEQKYTPTGFSVQEVRELGDFPDYAELSGVSLPQPYHEFDIDKSLARLYRPFRWVYHQTMSISKMEADWWIELEKTYKHRIAQRKDLYAKHGNGVLCYLPGSELACKELMEMVLQNVCARYPQYFSLVKKRVFQNRILGTEEDFRSKHPLKVLLDNIPEDFGVTLRDEKTGCYILRAGVICSSIGWSINEKMGLPLHLIHQSVPDYKEKMQTSMERFFTKLPTDKPIQRGSWGLEVGQPLWMPKGSPLETHRTHQSPTLQLSDCHLRVDWQTLRRLPLSAAIVFNFKALFTPVTEFRDEPGIPALVAKNMKEGKKNLLEYKGTWHVEHVILPVMEEWAEEQREKRLVGRDWEVGTLDESPYFRGWEEKWHRQQGF